MSLRIIAGQWRGRKLQAPQGENINFRHVAQALAEYDRDYDVQMVAYDRYAFRRFEEDIAEVGLNL